MIFTVNFFTWVTLLIKSSNLLNMIVKVNTSVYVPVVAYILWEGHKIKKKVLVDFTLTQLVTSNLKGSSTSNFLDFLLYLNYLNDPRI